MSGDFKKSLLASPLFTRAVRRREKDLRERETEETLLVLDDWIEARERECQGWGDLSQLKPEYQEQQSQCLDMLDKLKNHRKKIGKHQSTWALSLCTAIMASAMTVKFAADMDVGLATLQRLGTGFKNKGQRKAGYCHINCRLATLGG